MWQMPAAIWNQIQEEQPLRSQFGRSLFSLSAECLEQALLGLERELMSEGICPRAIASFVQLAPLLFEKEAIHAFLQDHPFYYSALPNVTSVEDALMLAELDRPMSPPALAQLRGLLTSWKQYQAPSRAA